MIAGGDNLIYIMDNIRNRHVELLAPAGNFEKLIMAVLYGADAVYMAGTEFGMRAAAGNFTHDELKRAIDFCHDNGVKAYVTLNTIARNDELKQLAQFAEHVEAAGADAAIVTDVGVLSIIKRHAPSLEIHISTQAGVANYESALMWHDLGAKRVILARELSLEEIAGIRAKTSSDLDIECFVHGAVCFFRAVACYRITWRGGCQQGRMRPAVPVEVLPSRGKA